MKGKLCDGFKGLWISSIILMIFGIVSIIIGLLIENPFLLIGIVIIILAILLMIPHEYIDKKVIK